MKSVNGEAGAGNNNTVNNGELYPVITGLQQRVRDHYIFSNFAR